MQAIDAFQGQYRFLSNFFPATLEFHGAMWPTSEHAYQAAKTLDLRWKLEVQQQETPGLAKKRGRLVDMRPDWERVKVRMMLQIVSAKFIQNRDLMRQLVETGDAELIEGNKWGDTFWGVCQGKGENNLGQILMVVRDQRMG